MRFIILLSVVLTASISVQAFRTGVPERWTPVNQKLSDEKVNLAEGEKPSDHQMYFLVNDEGNQNEEGLVENIERTLRMAKIPHRIINLHEAKGIKEGILSMDGQDVLVWASETPPDDYELREIERFVGGGGTLILPLRAFDSAFDKLGGIKEKKGFREDLVNGYVFKEKVFPGLDDLQISDGKIPHSVMELELEEDVRILAEAEQVPLVWEHAFGQGHVMYFNTTMLMDKANRGLLLQYFLKAPAYGVSTIMNAKIFNIDDFPAPVRRGRTFSIERDHHFDNLRFYKYIWWSDLYNLSVRYNLKYTGLVIGTYNGATGLPLPEIEEWQKMDLRYFGRKLGEVRGELGIHGYNHFPLALEGEMAFDSIGYAPWESREAMEAGLDRLKVLIEELYGEIPVFTYVPPSNMIGAEGKKAVKNVFEDLMVYAGLYTGPPVKGVLYQEFEEDPDVPGTYDFPRLSSGYEYSDEIMWHIFNGIAHYGIVNHFIHPDDLMDPMRAKGMSWREMKEGLEKIVESIQTTHPYLIPMSNYEAVKEFIRHENMEVYTRQDGKDIVIDHVNGAFPVFHYVRLRGEAIERVENGKFYPLDASDGLYLVEAYGPRTVMKVR